MSSLPMHHPRGLYERTAELAAFDRSIVAAADGGRLLLVEGPPGIGKTRLLAEARARARAADMEVVTARGVELERERSYGVVRQLFEPLLAALPSDERSAVLAGPAGAAAPVVQATGALDEPAGGADGSFSALHGLYWLTANLSARRPLLICIDDLDWSDLASLRWLAYLLPRMEDLRVLVVASARAPHHGGIVAQLAADPLAAVLVPAPLSPAGATAVVHDLLSTAADPAFCAACHGESGGNPLWLRELVRAVVAQGLEPGPAAASRLRELGAQAVRRTVSMRLRRLPEAAIAMAHAVAVLGDGTPLEHAAALARLDCDESFEGVLTLQAFDVLRMDPGLGFVHPVVRAAFEAEMRPLDRRRGHRRAAALLAHHGAEPERVAAHLLKAPAEGDAAVVETLRAAARGALGRGAPESGVAYLERALREPPAADVRADVLIELGLSETLVSGPAAAEHLAAAIALLRDPRRRAELGFVLGRTLYFLSRVDEAVRAYERALGELPPGDTPLRRLLDAAHSHAVFTLAGPAGFVPARRSAAPPPADAGARWLEALAAYVDAHSGASAEDAAARAERALAGSVFFDHDNGGGGLAVGALVVMHADRDVRPLLDEVLARAHAHGSVLAFAAAKAFRARAGFLRGQLQEAESDAADALGAIEQWNIEMGAPYAAAYLADALMERGRLDDAAQALARGNAAAQPAFIHMHWHAESAARLRLLRGDLRGGVADLLDAGRRMESLGLSNPAFTAWRSQAAIALLALGERDRAAALAADELQLSRRWGAPRALAASLRAAGLAEGGAAGLTLLEEAVAVAAESPARLEHAKALVELGAALRRANRRIDARERLRHGLDIAFRHGATPLAQRAHTELLATGARSRRLMLSGPDALTASERRVADLAAAGASNREIAQTLFVTTKTVEVHLTSAYRKLDIRSRVQLPGALAAA